MTKSLTTSSPNHMTNGESDGLPSSSSQSIAEENGKRSVRQYAGNCYAMCCHTEFESQ